MKPFSVFVLKLTCTVLFVSLTSQAFATQCPTHIAHDSLLATGNSQAAECTLATSVNANFINDIKPNSESNKVSKKLRLSDYQWQYRILLTTVDSSADLRNLEEMLLANWFEFEERKLAVFAVIDTNKLVRIDETGALPAQIDISHIQARMKNSHTLLIGLDGGSKAVYEQFDQQQLFADIDGMPMRRFRL